MSRGNSFTIASLPYLSRMQSAGKHTGIQAIAKVSDLASFLRVEAEIMEITQFTSDYSNTYSVVY